MGLIPEFEDYQIVQVLFGNISLFLVGKDKTPGEK